MSAKRLLQVLPLVAALALPACDGAGTPAGDRVRGAPAQLAPIDHSGVSGTAVADRIGDHVLVTLAVEGLRPGVDYSAELMGTRCAEGALAGTPLGGLEAGPRGTATEELRVRADDVPADGPLSVQLLADQVTPVACADLRPLD